MGTRQFAYGSSDWAEDLRQFETDDAGVRRLASATGRLERIAQEVVLAKADAACEAMILLATTRLVLGRYWKDSDIRCGRAEVQKNTAVSTLEFRRQAAHLLPGNVQINGKSSWTLIERYLPGQEGIRLAAHLQMAFASTISLPPCFNIADSKAESGEAGLKKAFADAVIVMGRQLGPNLKQATPFRLAIDAGLKHWFAQVDIAYAAAADEKRAKARDKTASKAARERRLLEARVLSEYHRSCRIANPLLRIYASESLATLLERQAGIAANQSVAASAA